MSHQQTVLVIDDDPLIHKLVAVRIRELHAQIECADSGQTGLELAHQIDPHLILLDVSMPDMSGFEVCKRLSNDPLTRDIPVIFLTGTDNPDEKVKAFELGAVDYVTKPFNPAELRARVRAALRTQALVQALEMQAQTDSLTGLPNREACRRAISRCIESARQHQDRSPFALLFLDLDRFKIINDSLGHAIGDELLIAVANKLYNCVRKSPRDSRKRGEDMVARMGGDEFAILLHDVENIDVVTIVADRIQRELSQPLILQGYQVSCGVSIGIRMCEGGEDSADALLRDSDTAMYQAKASGKGQHAVFDAAMHETVLHRLEIEHDLQEALSQEQFQLQYQPIVALEDGELLGYEALIRWHHPERGVVMPDEFIPVAEETGLITDIGRWVLREACAQLREWSLSFSRNDIYISVNISKAQLRAAEFEGEVRSAIADTRIQPHQLCLEVTESVIMHESRTVVPVLQQLHDLGVRLAMDDFGTGYSSLASLHRFPIDALKIDKEFIQRLSNNRPYAAIVHAIITLAHNLDLHVIAEGLDASEQLAVLQALECDSAQGYHLGKPANADDAARFLENERPFSRHAA